MCIHKKKIIHQFGEKRKKDSMYHNLKYTLQKKNTILKIFKITLTLTNLTEITFVIEPKIILENNNSH